MTPLARLKWLAGQVSPIEVAARLRLDAMRRMSRNWNPRIPEALVTRPVFGPLAESAATREAFRAAGLAPVNFVEADLVMVGEFSLFNGYPYHAPEGIPDWLASIPSGERWSGGHSFDIDISGHDGRDVRFTWELSRHGDITALARAAFLSSDTKYRDRALALLSDWIDANPFLQGPNWISALEVGIRGIAWAFIEDCLGGDLGLGSMRKRFLETLYLHGLYLDRFLSRGVNPSNHIMGEAAGLFILGSKFAAVPHGRHWRALGARILEEEIARQTFASGASREQSLCYHRFVTGLCGLCLAVGGKRAFGKRFRSRLEAMYDYLNAVARPDGSFADIGDSDNGTALRLGSPRLGDLTGELALGAALFPHAGLGVRGIAIEHSSGLRMRQQTLFAEPLMPAAEVLWLLGAEALKAPLSKPAGARRSRIFEGADMAILKSPSGALQAEFDAGPQGYTPVASHGHADALSVTLWREGERFIDAGTYRYNGSTEWRDAFRSTPFHNTLTVDGISQAEPASAFRWRTRADASVTGRLMSPAFDCVAGVLEPGEGRPWRHMREVARVGEDILIAVDTVTAKGEHTARSYFHFGDADVSAAHTLAEARFQDKGRLGITCVNPAAAFDIVHPKAGGTRPLQSTAPYWRSPVYGVRQLSATAVATAEFAGSIVLPWVIALKRGIEVRQVPVDVGKAWAVEITGGGPLRLFVALEDWNLAHVAGVKFVGRWGLFEFEGDALTRAWGSDAWILEYQGQRRAKLWSKGPALIYEGHAQE